MGKTAEPAERAQVVGILGSPRRGGNTETLLDHVLRGAADAGLSTGKLVLSELNISPCQNCGYCMERGECRIRDDMDEVYGVLDNVARIVVASPIYFTNVSAQTKGMVDRCQVYWARRQVLGQKAASANRYGYFVSVGGFRKAQKFFDCARRLIASWCSVVGISYKEGLFYEHVDALGDAKRHPTATRECYDLGKRL